MAKGKGVRAGGGGQREAGEDISDSVNYKNKERVFVKTCINDL